MAMDAFSASLMKDKREIVIAPTIYKFDTFGAFAEEFKLGERDVVLTNEFIYKPFMEKLGLKSNFVFQEKFGAGEPSEAMIETMYEAIPYDSYDRVIAVGGGAIMDLCKLLGCKRPTSVHELYFKREPVVHEKEVIAIPTTCGTGSEVTNISIINRTTKGVKVGLVSPAMFADEAALVPGMLLSLPYPVFATSSIDAMVHAVESYLSPNACALSELFSEKALHLILSCWKDAVASGGKDAWKKHALEFLRASNYAGIAFGHAGCAAVHAMAYPLGGVHHIPHGQANQLMFADVMRKYQEKKPIGKLNQLEELLGAELDTEPVFALETLYKLMDEVLEKGPLHEHGVTVDELPVFAKNVIETQQRLLGNNYVELTEDDLLDIYRKAF